MKADKHDRTEDQATQRAGWTPERWSREVDISRTSYYGLRLEDRPASIRVGRRVVIVESPAAWLARVKAQGGVCTLKPEKAAA